MTTKVFKSVEDFIWREDRKINGVSEEFALSYPGFEKDNETNNGCWNCLNCSYCNDCRDSANCYCCSGLRNCMFCTDVECGWDSAHCSDCFDCVECMDCHWCLHVWGELFMNGLCGRGRHAFERSYKIKKSDFIIPKIENIHQKVLEAALKKPETNRFRLVIDIAGDDGLKLEGALGCTLAANKIYKASSNIAVPWAVRWKDDQESKMMDIKRCAELEREASINTST